MAISLILQNNLSRTHILTTVDLPSHEVTSLYLSLSRVRLFATPWTAAHQATPSMRFSSKSTGVGCHCLL